MAASAIPVIRVLRIGWALTVRSVIPVIRVLPIKEAAMARSVILAVLAPLTKLRRVVRSAIPVILVRRIVWIQEAVTVDVLFPVRVLKA